MPDPNRYDYKGSKIPMGLEASTNQMISTLIDSLKLNLQEYPPQFRFLPDSLNNIGGRYLPLATIELTKDKSIQPSSAAHEMIHYASSRLPLEKQKYWDSLAVANDRTGILKYLPSGEPQAYYFEKPTYEQMYSDTNFRNFQKDIAGVNSNNGDLFNALLNLLKTQK